jgi:hypothetical protein
MSNMGPGPWRNEAIIAETYLCPKCFPLSRAKNAISDNTYITKAKRNFFNTRNGSCSGQFLSILIKKLKRLADFLD